jgi:hypothetical protein
MHVIEKPKLSFQAIMGKFEQGPTGRRCPNLTWASNDRFAPEAAGRETSEGRHEDC